MSSGQSVRAEEREGTYVANELTSDEHEHERSQSSWIDRLKRIGLTDEGNWIDRLKTLD